MKKLKNTKEFVVVKQQVDDKGKLVLAVLIDEFTQATESVLKIVKENYKTTCSAYKLTLLADSYLGDKVLIKTKIVSFREGKLVLKTTMFKVIDSKELCVATAVSTYDLSTVIIKAAS